MPDGRFISKTIAHSEQLAGVSLNADYLFTRCIPHLDREGRMTGNAQLVKAIAVPLRDEITAETIPALLGELADAELIQWYEVEGKQVIQFPAFANHQKGMKKDREAPSRFPPPDGDGKSNIRPASGEGPAKVRSSSALHPAKVGVSEVEVKSKLSPREVKKASAANGAAVSEKPKSGKPTWLTPAKQAWEAQFGPGSFREKQAAGLLAPLRRAGVADDEIGRRLAEYVKRKKGGYCTLADFAAHHGEYVPVDRGPALLDGGVLSAYGEEITRPDGMPAPKGWYS